VKLDKVEVFALLEADDGLLPVVGASLVGTALTPELASLVESANTFDLLAKQRFNGALDLDLVGTAIHLEDDVVVRLTPWGAGTRVDVRSVSRVGRGDAGTNARRVQTFLERLQAP